MFIKPPAHLSPYIKEIWSWEDVETESLPWILPSYEIELVLHFSEQIVAQPLYGDQVSLPRMHWVGPQNRRWRVVSPQKLNLISIRFYAGAPYELFQIPAKEMINSFPSFEDPSRTLKLLLEKEILPSQETRKEILPTYENFLILLFELWKMKKIHLDPKIKIAFHELLHSNLSITEIAKKIDISRKQLERGMSKVYGIAPGELRKIHRILSLIRNPSNYKSENEVSRLTDIAYEFGYTDQSHLIHDFKSITGYLPKDWFKNFEKMSYFYNSSKSS